MTTASQPQPDEDLTMLNGLLRTHSLAELTARTAEAIRKQPVNANERWLLFQLLCMDGEWNRALQQLQAWAKLVPDGEQRATLYGELVRSECFRIEVFAGKRNPGHIDPWPQWVEQLVEANRLLAAGNVSASDALRETALDAAPATPGTSPQVGAFEWIADSDSRLGPVFELAVTGGYRWIPFDELGSISFAPITTLIDLVWRQATVTLRSNAVLRGYAPVRYPGSEAAVAELKLARKTEWTDIGATGVIALGQKTWTTDHGDVGLLDLLACRFHHDTTPDAAALETQP